MTPNVLPQRPPYHSTPNSFLRWDGDAHPSLPHSLASPHITQEMRSTVSNYNTYRPDDCFPFSTLPEHYLQQDETPEQALRRILDQYREKGLYSKEGKWDRDAFPGSDEERIANLFNKIVQFASDTPPGRCWWRSHERKMVEKRRKPDVVLVSQCHATSPSIPFSAILSYCELKKTSDPSCQKNVRQQQVRADRQLVDLAGHVTSSQLGRRFFVGLTLCNLELSVALIIRGCYIFTTAINIDTDPLPFINIILTITAASPTWLGFDTRFEDNTATITPMRLTVVRTLFGSSGMAGRGTIVYLCKHQLDSPSRETRHYILKETWLNAHWPTDIDNHLLMRSAAMNIHPFENAEEEEIFGPQDKHRVFEGCVSVPAEAAWSYGDHNLPGLPVMTVLVEPEFNLPDHREEQANGRLKDRMKPDTTENILDRIRRQPNLRFQPRKHISTLSATVGVPITMFSCRRELLNGMMGVVSALFNGMRLQVLHCDVSQSNIMLRAAKVDEEDVVPDWPEHGYVKRAGFLTDWGLGQQYPGIETHHDRVGCVTGTFPFIAIELLSQAGLQGHIAHQPHHDLESLFWVLWAISLNYNGPYGKRRKWAAPNGQVLSGSSLVNEVTHQSWSARRQRGSASVIIANYASSASTHDEPSQVSSPDTPSQQAYGNIPSRPPLAPSPVATTYLLTTSATHGAIRYPVDDEEHKTDLEVPVWATPEPHTLSFSDVRTWKYSALKSPDLITSPVSPYFSFGPGGDAFVAGIEKLAIRFCWKYVKETRERVPPENPITHREFLEVLASMRDAIGDYDRPTEADMERGRTLFKETIGGRDATKDYLAAMQPGPESGSSGKRSSAEPLSAGGPLASRKRTRRGD